jgi:mannose-1-phosphate guanylyltransferase
MQSLEHLWAIVLAAGEGKRLAALTRALHGATVPKQFAFFSANKRSLVQSAVDRLSPLVPNERIVVVVPAADVELAKRQLLVNPPISVLLEPQTRGTGPSLLLAVAAVLEKDPAAQVAVVPAAHVVQRPEAFLEGILRARAELSIRLR